MGKRGDEVNSPILVGVSLLFRYPRVSKEGLATSSKLSMTLESQIRFTSGLGLGLVAWDAVVMTQV